MLRDEVFFKSRVSNRLLVTHFRQRIPQFLFFHFNIEMFIVKKSLSSEMAPTKTVENQGFSAYKSRDKGHKPVEKYFTYHRFSYKILIS